MVASTEARAIPVHESAERERALREMDALARGVEARLKLVIGLSEMVTCDTLAIARQLGINKRTIGKWVARRAAADPDISKSVYCLFCW